MNKQKITEINNKYILLAQEIKDIISNVEWEEFSKDILYQYNEEDKHNAEIFEITVYDRHFESYPARIEIIFKDGTIIVYVEDKMDYWTITTDDIYETEDKLTFLIALYGYEL